ncbi:MAG: hypothetical protein QM765_01440 [Myxococcales bacterium]
MRESSKGLSPSSEDRCSISICTRVEKLAGRHRGAEALLARHPQGRQPLEDEQVGGIRAHALLVIPDRRTLLAQHLLQHPELHQQGRALGELAQRLQAPAHVQLPGLGRDELEERLQRLEGAGADPVEPGGRRRVEQGVHGVACAHPPQLLRCEPAVARVLGGEHPDELVGRPGEVGGVELLGELLERARAVLAREQLGPRLGLFGRRARAAGSEGLERLRVELGRHLIQLRRVDLLDRLGARRGVGDELGQRARGLEVAEPGAGRGLARRQTAACLLAVQASRVLLQVRDQAPGAGLPGLLEAAVVDEAVDLHRVGRGRVLGVELLDALGGAGGDGLAEVGLLQLGARVRHVDALRVVAQELVPGERGVGLARGLEAQALEQDDCVLPAVRVGEGIHEPLVGKHRVLAAGLLELELGQTRLCLRRRRVLRVLAKEARERLGIVHLLDLRVRLGSAGRRQEGHREQRREGGKRLHGRRS